MRSKQTIAHILIVLLALNWVRAPGDSESNQNSNSQGNGGHTGHNSPNYNGEEGNANHPNRGGPAYSRQDGIRSNSGQNTGRKRYERQNGDSSLGSDTDRLLV